MSTGLCGSEIANFGRAKLQRQLNHRSLAAQLAASGHTLELREIKNYFIKFFMSGYCCHKAAQINCSVALSIPTWWTNFVW
jgi:hypothetical protein